MREEPTPAALIFYTVEPDLVEPTAALTRDLGSYFGSRIVAVQLTPACEHADGSPLTCIPPATEAALRDCNCEVKVSLLPLPEGREPNREQVAQGLAAATRELQATCLVCSHPSGPYEAEFDKLMDQLAQLVKATLVAVKFRHSLSTERILIPVAGSLELASMTGVVAALSDTGEHHLRLVSVVAEDCPEQRRRETEESLQRQVAEAGWGQPVEIEVIRAASRLQAIVAASDEADLTVVGADRRHPLRQFFFGSLAEDIARLSKGNVLIVYPGAPQAQT